MNVRRTAIALLLVSSTVLGQTVAPRSAPTSSSASPTVPAPNPGHPLEARRYHPIETPFPGTLTRDQLGTSVSVIGDLDGNGIVDVVMGAAADHVQGECWRGAVWIVKLASTGRSIGELKIREGESGFSGDLDADDRFGEQACGIGDLNLDGVPDIAVGAPGDDDLSTDAGAVWLLFLEPDGSVGSWTKLLPPVVGPGVALVRSFGAGLTSLGDLNGDGTPEIAIGAKRGDEAGEEAGVVYITSLFANGSLSTSTKISANYGPFIVGDLSEDDDFGSGLAKLSDVDGNGVSDLAVGAPGDDSGNTDAGAIWILRLSSSGSVMGKSRISRVSGGGPLLNSFDRFGSAIAELGDLDSDGVPDLAVGAPKSGAADGGVWILHMNANRTVKSTLKHSQPTAGPQAAIEVQRGFGAGLAALGDLDNDGIEDVMAGCPGRETVITGQVFTLFLRADGTLKSSALHGLSGWRSPAFLYTPSNPEFAGALCRIGDLDGDGGLDLAVGQSRDGALSAGEGALWFLHFNASREVVRVEKFSRATGFLPTSLREDDQFGSSVCTIGDVDNDGFEDLAVGARGDEDGAGGDASQGAVWILFRGAGGGIARTQEISRTQGGLGFTLSSENEFGNAVCPLGDLDGDGVEDLAVGAPGRLLGQSSSGYVYVLFLNTNGTVKVATRFPSLSGLSLDQKFGFALAHLGGNRIAIGEREYLGGRVWIVDLAINGQPASYVEISDASGGFPGVIQTGDRFGEALAALADLDGDGRKELAVGSPGAHFPAPTGQIYVLFLRANGTVRRHVTISRNDPPINLAIDAFGTALADAGDLNGDGVGDLLVGNKEDRVFPNRCEDGVGVVMTLLLDGIPGP